MCYSHIDSIATAIALAYYYKEFRFLDQEVEEQGEQKKFKLFFGFREIIPILHMNRAELNDRRDLLFYLQSHGIAPENIVCL